MANIYRLDSELSTTILEVGSCNGPYFSLDGGTFYFADSPRRRIYSYDYDVATGRLANRRVFADTNQFNSPPDGATVDSEGFLWSTMFTGGKIVRVDPTAKWCRPLKCQFATRSMSLLRGQTSTSSTARLDRI